MASRGCRRVSLRFKIRAGSELFPPRLSTQPPWTSGIWRPSGKAAWGLNAARPLAGAPGSQARGRRISVLIGRVAPGGWGAGF